VGGGNNHKLKYWPLQAIGWGCFILFNFILNISGAQEIENHFIKIFLFVLIGILLTHLMRYFILRNEIVKKSYTVQIISFISLSILFSVLLSIIQISTHIIFGLSLRSYGEKTTISLIFIMGVYSFFVYAPWNSLYFLFHYVEKSDDHQLEKIRLEYTVKDLELKNINSYISPHFIFNALNSIRALINEDPAKARDAVTSLASILRNSLQLKKHDVVALETELETVRDYLALQHIRFENRLKVEYDIDPSTLAVPVPILMLQTLVENAIKHGISRQVKGGLIRISSMLNQQYLELVVQNTGRLNSNLQQSGFGWSSTSARLALLFGEEASLQMRTTRDKLVEVTVKIPVRMATPALA